MRTNKSRKSTNEPSLRDKLTQAFVEALQADFEQHGVSTIEKLREKYPERYIDACTRLTVPAEPPPAPGDYSECKSVFDVARKMLVDNGMHPDAITDAMVEQAAEAAEALKDRLDAISKGN